MYWDSPAHLKILSTGQVEGVVQKLSRFLVLSMTPSKISGNRAYSQYHLSKVGDWHAAASFCTPKLLADSARSIVQGFICCGASEIIASSIPDYWEDGSVHAYAGPLSETVIDEIAGEWGVLDFVILAQSSAGDIVAAVLFVPDDYAIFIGPRRFIERALGNSNAAMQALLNFSAQEGRTDIPVIVRELGEYQTLCEGGKIKLPLLTRLPPE